MKINGLYKAFGEKKIFENYTLDFGDENKVALMGASGSGKTTLINILLGIYPADAGEISGLEKEKLSVVFQENRLVESLTVRANLRAVLGKDFPEERMKAALEALDLADAYQKSVSILSGGMKRRVAIARALLYPHTFLILDEPFKGLDEETKDKVMSYVKEESKNKKMLLITHDPREAEFMEAKIYKL